MSDQTQTPDEKFTTEEIAKLSLDMTTLRAEIASEERSKARIKVWGHLLILVIGTALAAAIMHDVTGMFIGSAPAMGLEIFDRIAKLI